MFFVGGCFLSLSTAGLRSLTLSTYAFNAASSQKKHQKALPMVLRVILFLSYVFFLQIINSSPKLRELLFRFESQAVMTAFQHFDRTRIEQRFKDR